ncbi:NOP58 family protein [Candidatus Woesearchaeota archaeon]|nr:NOP58 family protein [Candidatus Woesearchaeota archaeon]
MKYLWSTIIGCFVFNTNLDIIDNVPFRSSAEYLHREQTEAKLSKKYPDLKPLPEEKIAGVLLTLKNPSYFRAFHTQNLELTKIAIKNSVTEDGFILQTIANITEIDKVSNTLSKRLREWYALYYPELAESVVQQEKFVELTLTKSKEELMRDAKRTETMGADMAKVHRDEILLLARQIKGLFELRRMHEQYLQKVMQEYCPNLLELAGTTIGAKLLELSRGLKHLALLPASTIQLLGAEKALFRHLKTGSKSPKYGILYQHPLIQKAPKQERGKAARNLADKLSLCARLDYFKGEFKALQYRKELEEKFNP